VSERFLAHPRRALLAGAALLVVVLIGAAVVPSGPLRIDRWWNDLMGDGESEALKQLALVLNWLGRGVGQAVALVGIGVVLAIRRRWLALVAFALAEALSSFGAAALKAHVGRPRPPGGLVHPVSSSFPSGHAAYAGVTCVALVLLFTAPGRRRRLWWTLAAIGIAAMAWSRTYLHVHWLSDVASGAMFGVGAALLVFGAAQLRRR
jgi:undecaprenyl-diphosphatase